MLAHFPLNPILPAKDGARAEAFYRDVLGLDQLSPPGMDPMAFSAGKGSMIVLSELPDRVPPAYPVVAFLVEGIEELVTGLAERGVEFFDPQPASFHGTEGAIEGAVINFGPVKSTWLRDSEDNNPGAQRGDDQHRVVGCSLLLSRASGTLSPVRPARAGERLAGRYFAEDC